MTIVTDHRKALLKLVQFGRPIAELRKDVLEFPYDFEGIPVQLTKKHVAHALQLAIEGKISAIELETWARVVEGRPGIEYEDAIAERLNDVIFRLATPKINEPITSELCRRLLKELGT